MEELVGDAKDGAAGRGKEKLFYRDAKDIDPKEMGDVVEAMNELGVEEENAEEQEKVQSGEAERTDEHGRDEVTAEEGDHHGA